MCYLQIHQLSVAEHQAGTQKRAAFLLLVHPRTWTNWHLASSSRAELIVLLLQKCILVFFSLQELLFLNEVRKHVLQPGMSQEEPIAVMAGCSFLFR